MGIDLSQKKSRSLIFITLLVLLPGLVDFILDHGLQIKSYHEIRELFILLISLLAVRILWKKQTSLLREEIQVANKNLQEIKDKTKSWQTENQSLIKGLGESIDLQFEKWNLSKSEKEVGLMLLKGITVKEIADIRGVKEKTVRQQCQGIYKKAGISGRNQLSAYFLEDLLLPEIASKKAG